MGIIKANIIDIANMLHNNDDKNVNHFSFIFFEFCMERKQRIEAISYLKSL